MDRPCRNSPTRARAATFLRFLDHTQWHTTVGETPLGEGSARRRDLYPTTLTRDRHSCRRGIRTAIPASERPQTLAFDRSAAGIISYVKAFRHFAHRCCCVLECTCLNLWGMAETAEVPLFASWCVQNKILTYENCRWCTPRRVLCCQNIA